jgi:hypothetical protein
MTNKMWRRRQRKELGIGTYKEKEKNSKSMRTWEGEAQTEETNKAEEEKDEEMKKKETRRGKKKRSQKKRLKRSRTRRRILVEKVNFLSGKKSSIRKCQKRPYTQFMSKVCCFELNFRELCEFRELLCVFRKLWCLMSPSKTLIASWCYWGNFFNLVLRIGMWIMNTSTPALAE